jgi:hypothetical protein
MIEAFHVYIYTHTKFAGCCQTKDGYINTVLLVNRRCTGEGGGGGGTGG